jgi:hypothetical protein
MGKEGLRKTWSTKSLGLATLLVGLGFAGFIGWGLHGVYRPDLTVARERLNRLSERERLPFTAREVLFADYDTMQFVFRGTLATRVPIEGSGTISGAEFERHFGRPGLLMMRVQGSSDQRLFGLMLSATRPAKSQEARLLEAMNRVAASSPAGDAQ